MKLMNCQRNAIDLLPFHTHAQTHTHTQTCAATEWAALAVGCQTKCPANSCALPLPLFASFYLRALYVCVSVYGCTRSAWILSIDVTAVKISQTTNGALCKMRAGESKYVRAGERCNLQIMLYKRFALCLLPPVLPHGVQKKNVYTRLSTGIQQGSLDGLDTLVIKMLKYDLTCH